MHPQAVLAASFSFAKERGPVSSRFIVVSRRARGFLPGKIHAFHRGGACCALLGETTVLRVPIFCFVSSTMQRFPRCSTWGFLTNG